MKLENAQILLAVSNQDWIGAALAIGQYFDLDPASIVDCEVIVMPPNDLSYIRVYPKHIGKFTWYWNPITWSWDRNLESVNAGRILVYPP